MRCRNVPKWTWKLFLARLEEVYGEWRRKHTGMTSTLSRVLHALVQRFKKNAC